MRWMNSTPSFSVRFVLSSHGEEPFGAGRQVRPPNCSALPTYLLLPRFIELLTLCHPALSMTYCVRCKVYVQRQRRRPGSRAISLRPIPPPSQLQSSRLNFSRNLGKPRFLRNGVYCVAKIANRKNRRCNMQCCSCVKHDHGSAEEH